MNTLERQLKEIYPSNGFQRVRILGPYSAIETLLDIPAGVPNAIMLNNINNDLGYYLEKTFPEFKHDTKWHNMDGNMITIHKFERYEDGKEPRNWMTISYDTQFLRASVQAKDFDFKIQEADRLKYIEMIKSADSYMKALAANFMILTGKKAA